MHLQKAYMYIDFHQNRDCRSVKTVHTNLFAQYRQLHKFATTNSNFEKKKFFMQTYITIKLTLHWRIEGGQGGLAPPPPPTP